MSNWTAAQELAIKTRGGELLVSAAAGTGKTAVLVERIIRLITREGVDCDRLLVATFTNAAAAEMKSRLRHALFDKLSANPQDPHLNNQLALLDRTFIGTIHSFCLEIIKQYFYLAELDPNLRVAAEEEAGLLRQEACEELFEQRYDAVENGNFTALFDCYGGKDGWRGLQELVLRLHNYACNSPFPREWLRAKGQSFFAAPGATLEEQPWFPCLREYVILELEAALSGIREAIELAGLPQGPANYLDTLHKDRELIAGLCTACSSGKWEKMSSAFKNVSFDKLKASKQKSNKELKDKAKKLRDGAKKKVSDLHEQIFSRNETEYLEELNLIAPFMLELTEITVAFGETYRQAKKAHGVIDFNDLEHLALKILLDPDAGPGELFPSEAARQIQNRFAEILVDEYQDINPVQEAILSLIARDNIFMVGDVKQSIYGFRLTEPGIFMAKHKAYTDAGEDVLKGKDVLKRKVNLTHNFRCQKNLIDFVNGIFSQLLNSNLSGINYEELVYGANYPPREEKDGSLREKVELHLLASAKEIEEPEENESNEQDSPEELETVQREARFIAGRILEMTSQGAFSVWDKEIAAYRPVQYRDMAVLMRSTVRDAPAFLDEFTKMGVPAYAEVSTGYFQAVEIQTMLSLLMIIDNPRQDIPLAGVLRSPLVGLSLEEMTRIRLTLPDGDFYDALTAFANAAFVCTDPPCGGAAGNEAEANHLQAKIKDFLQQLDRWRTISRRNPLSLLLWDIFRETGYYDFAGGLPGGRERQANLRSLLSRAGQYENTSFSGLSGFLSFIGRLQENNSDLGTALALGENQNVVRIMSIHKSKGLEFPVVFIAGLGKQFNFRDMNQNILLHKNLGLGPQFVDLETRVSYPTLPKVALRFLLKKDALAEEMRILYVAMTRAKEKLILVGSGRALEKAWPKWQSSAFFASRMAAEASLAAAKTFLDWICPVLLRQLPQKGEVFTLSREDSAKMAAALEGPFWKARSWKESEIFKQINLPGDLNAPGFLNKVSLLEPVEAGKEFAEIVGERLDWRYPYPGSSRPVKLSVTEAKRFFDILPHDEDPSAAVAGLQETASLALLRPNFLQARRELTATEKGRVIHLVMQHLELEKELTEDNIQEQIKRLLTKEVLTEEQAKTVDVRAIASFWQTPLGKRCLRAGSLMREVPFTLALPASEIYPEFAGTGETVLVQGMIDLIFAEDDGLVLIDFKSDYLKPGDSRALEQLKQKYENQVNLYFRAARTILKRHVKEAYLYFFTTGELVPVLLTGLTEATRQD